MTKCAKCGAELIGSRKFCAACGTPAVDPATLKRDASVAGPPSSQQTGPQPGTVPSTAYGPPSVNPFASTASPSSRGIGSPYGPPPEPQISTSQVSPLAVSNALSQRGAFQQVTGNAIPAPQQGTQLLPSVQNPSLQNPSVPSPSAPSAAPKRPDRTQLMDASSFVRPSQAHPSAPAPAPAPAPVPAPVAVPAPPPPPVQLPVQPPPQARPQQAWGGWNAAPPAPPAPQPFGFGYAPGARVLVTWSNGQRYPATVSQVSGTQCLVVFPDGQQHWVEMQYLSAS